MHVICLSGPACYPQGEKMYPYNFLPSVFFVIFFFFYGLSYSSLRARRRTRRLASLRTGPDGRTGRFFTKKTRGRGTFFALNIHILADIHWQAASRPEGLAGPTMGAIHGFSARLSGVITEQQKQNTLTWK